MMKVITGRMFNTSYGKIIAHNEIDIAISVGDTVIFDGRQYIVKDIIPPTNPEGKWSLVVALV